MKAKAHIAAWSGTTLILVGNIGLIAKQPWGMASLLVGDVLLVSLAYHKRDWSQVALFTVYSLFSIIGLVAWLR